MYWASRRTPIRNEPDIHQDMPAPDRGDYDEAGDEMGLSCLKGKGTPKLVRLGQNVHKPSSWKKLVAITRAELLQHEAAQGTGLS